MRKHVQDAIELAHTQSKPSLLEVITYRYRGHSMADPDETYRSKQEIQDYKETKDPINSLSIKANRDAPSMKHKPKPLIKRRARKRMTQLHLLTKALFLQQLRLRKMFIGRKITALMPPRPQDASFLNEIQDSPA